MTYVLSGRYYSNARLRKKNVMDGEKMENEKPRGFAAKWRGRMNILRNVFPSPWRESKDDRIFENTFFSAVSPFDQLKLARVYRDQNAWQYSNSDNIGGINPLDVDIMKKSFLTNIEIILAASG